MKLPFNKICVVGAGHIGLPTAALLACTGYQVLAVDINPSVVNNINAGQMASHEAKLKDYIHQALKQKHLLADIKPAAADVFILAVPTPIHPNYAADLSCLKLAIEAIKPYVTAGNLIIIESTIPVGTTEQISTEFDLNSIYLAYCPERVLPGNIMQELQYNDRIIGGINEISAQKAQIFYKTLSHGKLWLTDTRTAELTKLSENAFRDVNIAFANELALICEKLQIDVHEVIKLANHHPRVNILQPGLGVGGHCIPIDPWFIVQAAPEVSHLIKTARNVNNHKTQHIAHKIKLQAHVLNTPNIACLGLTYKPNASDARCSPAIEIIKTLAQNNPEFNLWIADPHINEIPSELNNFDRVKFVDHQQAVHQAELVILLVEHQQFSELNITDKFFMKGFA